MLGQSAFTEKFGGYGPPSTLSLAHETIPISFSVVPGGRDTVLKEPLCDWTDLAYEVRPGMVIVGQTDAEHYAAIEVLRSVGDHEKASVLDQTRLSGRSLRDNLRVLDLSDDDADALVADVTDCVGDMHEASRERQAFVRRALEKAERDAHAAFSSRWASRQRARGRNYFGVPHPDADENLTNGVNGDAGEFLSSKSASTQTSPVTPIEPVRVTPIKPITPIMVTPHDESISPRIKSPIPNPIFESPADVTDIYTVTSGWDFGLMADTVAGEPAASKNDAHDEKPAEDANDAKPADDAHKDKDEPGPIDDAEYDDEYYGYHRTRHGSYEYTHEERYYTDNIHGEREEYTFERNGEPADMYSNPQVPEVEDADQVPEVKDADQADDEVKDADKADEELADYGHDDHEEWHDDHEEWDY